MKLITPLLFISISLIFSCSAPANTEEEDSHETSKENTNEINDTTEVILDEIVQFNNSLVNHTDMAVVQIAHLMELDEQNVSADEMKKAAEEVKKDITSRIQNLKHLPINGAGGQEFVSTAIDHLTIVNRLADIYIKFADNLAIPDDSWDEEMVNSWVNEAEPIFLEYEDSYILLDIAQGNFSSLNDKDLVPAFDKSLEELQEEIQ